MIVRRLLNRLLAPAGMELRAKPPIAGAWTMEGVLHRLRGRELNLATVIDVGAAAGKWTRRALPHLPEASFLLLEPLEERRAALESLRQAHPRVHYAIAAAGERPGTAMLHVAEDLDGSGIYEHGADAAAREVTVTTVDAELARAQLAGPYFLKLDTHGFEVPILAGAGATLAQTAALLVEVYNFKQSPPCLLFPEMCAHLERLGFRCADVADPMMRPQDGVLWQMDLLFLRSDHPSFTRTGYRWT